MNRLLTHVSLCFVLAACQTGAIIARGGDHELRRETVVQHLQTLSEARRAAFIRNPEAAIAQLLESHVLADEARKLGLSAATQTDEAMAQALMREWGLELRRSTSPEEIADADLFPMYQNNLKFPHYPERSYVTLAVFKRPRDARKLVDAVGGQPSLSRFTQAYATQIARIDREIPLDHNGNPGAATGDVFITKDPGAGFPAPLVAAVFAAKSGAVVGPIATTCEQYATGCHYVVLIRGKYEEANSFMQVKEQLRPLVYEAKLASQLEAMKRTLLAKKISIDEQTLDALLQPYRASTFEPIASAEPERDGRRN